MAKRVLQLLLVSQAVFALVTALFALTWPVSVVSDDPYYVQWLVVIPLTPLLLFISAAASAVFGCTLVAWRRLRNDHPDWLRLALAGGVITIVATMIAGSGSVRLSATYNPYLFAHLFLALAVISTAFAIEGRAVGRAIQHWLLSRGTQPGASGRWYPIEPIAGRPNIDQ